MLHNNLNNTRFTYTMIVIEEIFLSDKLKVINFIIKKYEIHCHSISKNPKTRISM